MLRLLLRFLFYSLPKNRSGFSRMAGVVVFFFCIRNASLAFSRPDPKKIVLFSRNFDPKKFKQRAPGLFSFFSVVLFTVC